MSLLLRKLLARFLVLPVDGDPPADPPADPAADPNADPGGDTLDDLLGAPDPEDSRGTEPDPEPEPPAVKAARENSARLERELESERAARRALESRQAPAPAGPARDPDFEAEERQLADARSKGMDATSLYWLEWKIKTDRANRETRSYVDRTRRETEDIADRNAFERLETTKPQVFKRYKDRVETEIARLRAQGQNAPRLAVLRYLIGDDAVNGKIGTKSSKPATPAAPAPSQTVDRGRTPGTRTDVSGRIKQSERDARRARLEGKPL